MSWDNISEIINNYMEEKLDESTDAENSLNNSQKQAIRRIWSASMFPRRGRRIRQGPIDSFIDNDGFAYIIEPATHQEYSSYIIIGPPGTGKTTVIGYGALYYATNPQYRTRGRPRVFLCTSSNYGADRIFEKLIELLNNMEIRGWEVFFRRILAQSVSEDDISESVRNHVIKPRPSMGEDPRTHQEQLRNTYIFVGTIYAIDDLLRSDINIKSQTVIFDEASQLSPPEMYLPIANNTSARSFGLIGDDCQLPPISSLDPLTRSCLDYMRGLPEYENSRIHRQIILDIQYRMHPAIRDIASRFTRRPITIRDGPNVVLPSYLLQDYSGFEGHEFSNFLNDIFNPFKTVVIIDTSNLGDIGLDTRVGSSRINIPEIEIISGLTELLRTAYPNFEINRETLKIIAPYKPQARRIGRITGLNAATIDAFQGQEARIVFYSLTFADPDVRSRFAQNIHRIHVGLSRAQKKLIIIGNQQAMNQRYFEHLRHNIFNYNYDENVEPNIPLGYDPVSRVTINFNFYNYLQSIM